MDAAAQNEGQGPLADRLIRAGAAFEGSADIAEARAPTTPVDPAGRQPS